jgi:hypothetical protein
MSKQDTHNGVEGLAYLLGMLGVKRAVAIRESKKAIKAHPQGFPSGLMTRVALRVRVDG